MSTVLVWPWWAWLIAVWVWAVGAIATLDNICGDRPGRLGALIAALWPVTVPAVALLAVVSAALDE